MANVEKLSLVALTRSTSNAGSGDVLNVTIDIDGNDASRPAAPRSVRRHARRSNRRGISVEADPGAPGLSRPLLPAFPWVIT